MIKKRIFPEHNYRAIYFNGKTFRFALDNSIPVQELDFPEFYDVKITDNCSGKCKYCYMNSLPNTNHFDDIVGKTDRFFGKMTVNQRPFQVAIGGGEPTSHPDFIPLLEKFYNLGITPNYTTNGMFFDDGKPYRGKRVVDIINATNKYCGGVAISCHPHLLYYWTNAATLFNKAGIKLNFHIIISDKESSDYFKDIYDCWKDKVDYFVLLPYGNQGRAEHKEIDWEYLISVMPQDKSQLAFGANFYSNLVEDGGKNVRASLYEPEIFSKFLTLENDGMLYNSSFAVDNPIKTNLFRE